MPVSMDLTETTAMGRGKLVALEGDADLVSTQLRLLPPSQKILILPSILENIPQSQNNEAFDARSFIRNVHIAFTKRTQHAQSFLKSSTSMQPRLVFTHGGSVNARSTCITRIAESITNGKTDEAEALFNEIVQDGVAGLVRYEDKQDRLKTESKDMMDIEKRDVDFAPEDASTAAESLDSEAAGLEADEHIDDAEDTLCGETPCLEYDAPKTFKHKEDNFEDDENVTSETPLMNRMNSSFGRTKISPTAPQGEEIMNTMMIPPQNSTIWDRKNDSGSTSPQLASFSTTSYASVPISCEKSSSLLDDDFDTFLSETETFPSTPVVVYGEACLVDMYSNGSDSPLLRKIKSVDRMYPSLLPTSQSVSSPKSLRQAASFCHTQLRPTVSDSVSAIVPGHFQTVSRTTFVKASETTIRRSPTGSGCASSSKSSIKASSVKALATVDGSVSPESPEMNIEEEMKPFEAVFPVVEDLIINLVPMGSNEIFEMVLASYKNGTYPVFPRLDLTATESDEGLPRVTSYLSSDSESDNVHGKRNTYDPYAYHPNARTKFPLKYVTVCESPSSQDSPALSGGLGISDRVIDFSPLDSTNALNIQNSLRRILSVAAPTNDGYSQYTFHVDLEMERLWKPVFKIDESGSIGECSRTVDQIVALGCEVGVKPDFFSQISGQIERLGNKKNGLSRSGKVDIKYLIANVMQNLSTASTDSVLNPDVLAGLIVPQLESFLSTNLSTRLLILQYTSKHLEVILALQKLVGSDILKVAGIIDTLDTLSSDPPSFSRARTPREINPLSNEATMSRPTSRRVAALSLKQLSSSFIPLLPTAPQLVSFSKANYLVPTTATDVEITAFLSGIQKVLIERSSFYSPELPEIEIPTPITNPAIRPTTPRLLRPKSPSTIFSRHVPSSSDQVFIPLSSYWNPKTDKIVASRTSEHKYAQSIAPTVRTTAGEKERREDKEWENFYIADEDSEDDDYDKMIMGREFKMIIPESHLVKKRNTKKALKWLGLS